MALPIVIKAMNKNLSYIELVEYLKECGVTTGQFNNELLLYLCEDHKYHKIKLEPIYNDIDNKYEEDVEQQADEQIVTQMLEEFYKIDYSPSFLKHQALLCREDFRFALEIYAKAFSLNTSISNECCNKLTELFNQLGNKPSLDVKKSRNECKN